MRELLELREAFELDPFRPLAGSSAVFGDALSFREKRPIVRSGEGLKVCR